MVRRIKFGTAPLKWIIQICSREKPEQLFLLLNLWSSASKTFVIHNWQWQHIICLNAREATLNVEAKLGRGLLPGRLTFLSGGPEAAGGHISHRLSPAQPGGTCTFVGEHLVKIPVSSSHRPSLHGLSIPALWQSAFIFGASFLVVIFGWKRIWGIPTPVITFLGRAG